MPEKNRKKTAASVPAAVVFYGDKEKSRAVCGLFRKQPGTFPFGDPRQKYCMAKTWKLAIFLPERRNRIFCCYIKMFDKGEEIRCYSIFLKIAQISIVAKTFVSVL